MIVWSQISDKGGRGHNEDYVGEIVHKDRACFVLADGLGGHGKGEVASQLVTESILDTFENDYTRDGFLENAFDKAQNKLLEEQRKQGKPDEMKTTAVCLQIDGDEVRWGHCGDSRLYVIKGKKILQRTLDHSVPQMLVFGREIREKDIRFHEDRNRLLKVMGIEQDKKLYEVSEWHEYSDKTRFLMCSDGFWEFVLEKEMEKTLKKSDTPEGWLREMEKIVLERGKGKEQDNYSAIAVWME
ncbi:MAG: serine/threonine-protein phosphatase [Lachnospiraceae bacterium]|nr:serine/threonine-protein phosphatase [Lachnospiraceae bacterium]